MPRKAPAPPPTSATAPSEPISFLAAAAALAAIDDAVRTARTPAPADPSAPQTQQALAALLLLRELRTELAGWEAGLVETARATGATWADLAPPMGVASRQAAETRYLRLRPTPTPQGTATGAERVKAVRDHRAAERTVTAWARTNATDLRILAAQLAALTDLPPQATAAQTALRTALGTADTAELIPPLTHIRPHLGTGHPDLATRLDDLTHHTDQLRHATHRRRT